MKVRLKLFANLAKSLPPESAHEGVELDVPDDTTAYQLLDRLEVPHELAHLVFRNGVFLPHEERSRSILREGDVIAVWPPIAGG